MDHISPAENKVSDAETPGRVVMTGEISADVLDLLQHAGLLLSSAEEPDVAFDSAASAANVATERVSVELDFSLACKAPEHEAAHLVFIYDSPECFIAKALEKGDSLDSAVGSCREYIESVLNFYRSNRRQITLMELQAVTANPTAALEVIERRTGIPRKQLDSHHSYSSQADVGDVALLVAACLQQEDYDLKRVVKELAASSALNGDHQTESVARRLLALHDESSARIGEAKQKEAENELLLLQLHQLQDELETYFERYQHSEKELESLLDLNLAAISELDAYAARSVDKDKKLDACNRVVEDLEKELEARRSENLLFVTGLEAYVNRQHDMDKKLNQFSRQLETRDRQNAELNGVIKKEREQLESLNKQLRQVRQTVSAMEQSKSWKLTFPLRWFLGIFLPSDR